jgi:hypothetical protein
MIYANWADAVHAAMAMLNETGQHWALEQVPGGWQVVAKGPYTGPAFTVWAGMKQAA